MLLYDGKGNKHQVLTAAEKSKQVSDIMFRTQYMAHGYGMDNYPPNSMPYFANAISKGYELIEVDIRFTLDNIPVGEHDDEINAHARNDDGTEIAETVLISESNYADLAVYDFGVRLSADFAGTRLLKIEDLLYYCKKKNVCIVFDLKSNEAAHLDALYELVINSGMKTKCVWCCTNLEHMTSKDTSLMYNLGISALSTMVKYQDKAALMVVSSSSVDKLTKEAVANIHANGFTCYAWTFNSEETAQSLFDNGVDYICTSELLNSSIR